MLVLIKDDYRQISIEASLQVASQIKLKPDSVIGFATGSTPLGLYKELIRMHKEEGLDFSKVISFNLDSTLACLRNTRRVIIILCGKIFLSILISIHQTCIYRWEWQITLNYFVNGMKKK